MNLRKQMQAAPGYREERIGRERIETYRRSFPAWTAEGILLPAERFTEEKIGRR